jgi:hypothetical protein
MMLTMRLAVLIALLALTPCGAQDLPDPGRRLSKEEQEADPDKPRPAQKAPDARQGERPRDVQICERSRVRYQMYCGVPGSPRSRSMDCAEAYALYRQSC